MSSVGTLRNTPAPANPITDVGASERAAAPRPPETQALPPIKVVERPLADPPEIGAHAADRVALSASPATAYLAAAGISARTAGELVDDDSPSFARLADPSATLRAEHAAHAARTERGVSLRMTTYNVGLLDTPSIMRFVPRLIDKPFALFTGRHIVPSSPHMDERRAVLPEMIFSRGDDVVTLQELWSAAEVERFSAAARQHGYVAVATPRSGDTDDLCTFIKASIIDSQEPIEHRHKPFAETQTSVRMTTHVNQGFQIVSFQHRSLGRINVVNTHMPPQPDKWHLRVQDAREIGLAVASLPGGDDAVTLLGGDLNGAPHYGVGDWRRGGAPSLAQQQNALSYAVLRHYGGFDDLIVAGRPANGVTDDVDAARRPVDPKTLPRYPFSVDPTNPLNVLQGGDNDPPERADHILGRSRRIKAMRSEMLFTQNLPGRDYPPSDHYGFTVELRIRPPKEAFSPP